MLCFGFTGLICCMFPALYSVAVLQFNWIVVQETLSVHYITVSNLHCRIMRVSKPLCIGRLQKKSKVFFPPEFLFSVSNPHVLLYGKGLLYPNAQCCDFWKLLYLFKPLYLFTFTTWPVLLPCCSAASCICSSSQVSMHRENTRH